MTKVAAISRGETSRIAFTWGWIVSTACGTNITDSVEIIEIVTRTRTASQIRLWASFLP